MESNRSANRANLKEYRSLNKKVMGAFVSAWTKRRYRRSPAVEGDVSADHVLHLGKQDSIISVSI